MRSDAHRSRFKPCNDEVPRAVAFVDELPKTSTHEIDTVALYERLDDRAERKAD